MSHPMNYNRCNVENAYVANVSIWKFIYNKKYTQQINYKLLFDPKIKNLLAHKSWAKRHQEKFSQTDGCAPSRALLKFFIGATLHVEKLFRKAVRFDIFESC